MGESTSERKECIVYKLAAIGALVAAVAAPATAAGHGVRTGHSSAQVTCPQTVILPGRTYGICGQRFWIRDPQTGQVKAVPFGRLQHQNDPTDDRP
jgi:hypothetical protein